MKRSLIVSASVVLTLAATTAVVAFQHAGGASTVAAAAPAGAESGAIVVDWNRTLVKIVNTPGAQPATLHPTRSFAILHVAIYDAVASTTHRGQPYVFALDSPPGARADAAAAQAGHDVLLSLYPSWKTVLDQQLAGELAGIPTGRQESQGAAVGALAARLTLALRADDGSSVTPPAIPAGTQPGEYRPAPPAFTPAVFTSGLASPPSSSGPSTSSGRRRPRRSPRPSTCRRWTRSRASARRPAPRAPPTRPSSPGSGPGRSG